MMRGAMTSATRPSPGVASVGCWWRRASAAVADLPLGVRIVLALAAALHGAGLSWGMPASDAWDVDGVAPRDVLPGLAETFTPGHFYTYPPLHLGILAVLTLPVTLAAAARAHSVAVPAVLQVILAPQYMTAIAMVARVVAVSMSLGIVASIALIARELAPTPRKDAAATAAAAFAAAGAAFTYYSHVTNLDVPYLFWAFAGLVCLVRAISRREPRRLRAACLFAALAVATKDQAYAMFLVSAPLAVGAWVAAERLASRPIGPIARQAALGVGLAAALLLLVDGALVNPSGFRARLAFLSGTASQDYATYSRDAVGRWLALVDTARGLKVHYPPVVAGVLVGVGLCAAVGSARRAGGGRIAALVPLAVALSFTIAFNLVARRVEDRFTLPQALALSVYGGLGLERVWAAFGLGGVARGVGRAAAAAMAALAVWGAVRVDAMFFEEPRYEAEEWLRAHAGSDDVIEVHGLNVYLLRFWPGARVVRVDPSSPDRRNPMPGVTEVQAPLSRIAERNPRLVVVNECYVWRYWARNLGGSEGRIVPVTQREDAENADATAFFRGLFDHRLGYSLAYESRVTSEIFPRVHVHASLGCPVFVFERDGP
jgi:hypothetical protein